MSSPIAFARDRLQSAGLTVPAHTIVDDLPAGGFRIRDDGSVDGGDAAGVMYGLLDLLDGVTPRTVTPRFPFRAAKFNLPWSSYRRGQAMSLHMDTCQDPAFWSAWLDTLAENRFNVLTLWNLHPFPYMFRPDGYPEACPFDDAELARWQDLWRFIFRRATERGIETYMVFWNIFVAPDTVNDMTSAEYHIGPGDLSQHARDYNRVCVRQLIDTYPDLTGIGFALGERMEQLAPVERQQWVKEVILAGAADASRPVKLIHRAPFTDDPLPIRQTIEGLDWPEPIYVEYKFNWSHGHSTPILSMTHTVDRRKDDVKRINDQYWNPPPTAYQMTWMVRNEDFFTLRWGQPDFVREHIQRNGHDYVAGYIVGSEGSIPAREYTRVNPTWDYGFQRNWLFWAVWGRLLHEPDSPDSVFAAAFDRRGSVGTTIAEAFRLVSQVPLRIASYFAATWDYTLYAEGFLAPRPSLGSHNGRPFISVQELIDHPTLDPRYLSVRDYVDGVAGEVTPLQLADAIERDMVAALQLAPETDDATLADELADIHAWAHLGLYFADKLRGAVALAQGKREAAVTHLEAAAVHWDDLIANTEGRIKRVPLLFHQGWAFDFHWSDFRDDVQADVDAARGTK